MVQSDLHSLRPLASVDGAVSSANIPNILVVDDQYAIRSLFEEVLTANGYRVSLARNLDEARALIQGPEFATIILDIFLSPEESGLSLIPHIGKVQPHTPVIVISGM